MISVPISLRLGEWLRWLSKWCFCSVGAKKNRDSNFLKRRSQPLEMELETRRLFTLPSMAWQFSLYPEATNCSGVITTDHLDADRSS
jgi:hypothetical protein